MRSLQRDPLYLEFVHFYMIIYVHLYLSIYKNIPAQKEYPKKDFSHLNLLKRKGSYHREIAPDVK